ncbi:MAG: putative transmembrane Tfp pilus assembly protein PilX (pilX) [Halomonadaceae bacterium T82-2]|nr:MAG: putative transmembrane Tfp pilus assembly protein PilX (pilX) [Halomonadaceae bacterium T82-2]
MSGRRQRGMTLLIALILLLAMSLLGVSALQGASLQARMAHSELDRQAAFQAASSALLEGEWLLRHEPFDPTRYAPACPEGRCRQPPTSPATWSDAQWRKRSIGYGVSGAPPLPALVEPPRLVIDYRGSECPDPDAACRATFVIVAHAWGRRETTQSTLQRRVVMPLPAKTEAPSARLAATSSDTPPALVDEAWRAARR